MTSEIEKPEILVEQKTKEFCRWSLDGGIDGDQTFRDLRLCVLPVHIEGEKVKQMYSLLVDTGSEATILTPRIMQVIGIKLQNNLIEGHGPSGKSTFQVGIVKSLAITEKLSLKNCRVLIGDLAGKFAKYNIVGILGAESLREFCLTIDYPGEYLEISRWL